MEYIQKLAADARPIDDDEWGSERQIAAENKFFEELESYLTGEAKEEFDREFPAMKATGDELINEGLKLLDKQTRADAETIAEAFRFIQTAAQQINEVLGRNDPLNETVPTNWPLNLSADEFAAECGAMVEHYEQIAEGR